MTSDRRPDSSTLVAFAIAAVIGGANFIAVSFSNRELDPLWGAGLRFSLAAFIFVAMALWLRLHWPRGRLLALTALYGALSFAGSYALLYWALVRVTAGAATIVLAIVPLLTLLLAAAHGTEKIHVRAVLGSLLALAGLCWMAFGPGDVLVPLDGLIAMAAAAVVMAESVIVGKRVAGNHPVMNNAVGMAVGASLLLVFSAILGESWTAPTQPEVFWSVAYLVTVGSVGLFVLVLLVVRRWTASATAYLFVVFPIVTMTLAHWLLTEPITTTGTFAAILVIAGVWIGAIKNQVVVQRAGRFPTPPTGTRERTR